MQNKTLAESDRNGVEVHLFEVLVPTEYIYRGLVSLAGKPYQEKI
jgi:5-methylcytosine-specific restriction protein A